MKSPRGRKNLPRMPFRRRAVLTLLAFSLLAPEAALSSAPTPEDDPAPFAARRASEGYWPVVTNQAEALVVSAQLTDGSFTGRELRCFNAPRPAAHADNPTRRHVGVDLFASPGDQVIAIEDGRIVGFYPFLRARTGEMSYALLIAHDGFVANYGEVRETSLSARGLSLGDHVIAGQEIAEISDTSQLHVETYEEGVTRNRSWRHGAPRPPGVLNPTRLLQDLARTGRRLHPG